jgi:hypothetical protein
LCVPSKFCFARSHAGFFLRYIDTMQKNLSKQLLLCLFIVLSQAAQAVLVPQPIGVHMAPLTPGVIVDDTVIDSSELLAHEQALQRVIERQRTLGAYHPELAKNWLNLAHQAVRLGQSESAANLFTQGLHNLRLNAGLTTDSQITALSDWIAVLRRLGDAGTLSRQLEYRYRITGFGGSFATDQSIEYALEYFDHELSIWAVKPWDSVQREVLKFAEHLEDVVDRACEAGSADLGVCGALVKRRLQMLYLIVYKVEPYIEERQSLPIQTQRRVSQPSITDDRLEMIERGTFLAGVRMLEGAIKRVEDPEELELALTDWRWFFGRTAGADEVYARLSDRGDDGISRPVELPHGLINNSTVGYTSESDESAAFGFRVTKRGRVRDIKATSASQNSRAKRLVRSALREVRFRPAIGPDGLAVDLDIEKTYQLTR